MFEILLEAIYYDTYNIIKNIGTDKSIFRLLFRKYQNFNKEIEYKLDFLHIMKPIIKNINKESLYVKYIINL